MHCNRSAPSPHGDGLWRAPLGLGRVPAFVHGRCLGHRRDLSGLLEDQLDGVGSSSRATTTACAPTCEEGYEVGVTLVFLDGHARAFAHFDGVPGRIVYDNPAPAVGRVQFPRRQLSERFAALSSHYLFEPCFARPGEGHDKGGVEARGKAIRLQHLTPVPRVESLAALAAAHPSRSHG